jgi:hypothetical protein
MLANVADSKNQLTVIRPKRAKYIVLESDNKTSSSSVIEFLEELIAGSVDLGKWK